MTFSYFYKMRHLFTLILLWSLNLSAQNQTDDVTLVINHMKEQESAWNRGDIPGFMEYYWKSDSLRFISSSGITYGWQKTIGKYLKSYPTKEAMGKLTFTIVEAKQLSPTSIYLIGQWSLEKEKPAGGYFTLLWRKKENRWVIVSDHTS